MGEFSKFQVTERGLYRIGVWDHKTVESYGLELYVDWVRSAVKVIKQVSHMI